MNSDQIDEKKPKTYQERVAAFFDPKKIYPKTQDKDAIEISEGNMNQFNDYQKHFIIMTEAGTVIYSRFGDEKVLSKVFAGVLSMVKKIQTFFSQVAPGEQSNRVRWITSGRFSCAILKKGSLIYLCLVNTDSIKSFNEVKTLNSDSVEPSKITSASGLGSDPFNYKIKQSRKCPESAQFIRL